MIKFFEKNRGLSLIILIIIASLIFYISSITVTGTGTTGYLSYIYHFTAFSYLTLFLLISITGGKKSNLIILGILLVIIYGILDELHQYFVPGRFPSIKDILINSIGILITSLAYSKSLKS